MHMVPELYKELLGRQTQSYPWTSVPSLGLLFLFGVDELQVQRCRRQPPALRQEHSDES